VPKSETICGTRCGPNTKVGSKLGDGRARHLRPSYGRRRSHDTETLTEEKKKKNEKKKKKTRTEQKREKTEERERMISLN